MSIKVLVNGDEYAFVQAQLRQRLGWPDEAEVEFPEDPLFEFGDEMVLKRGDAVIFRGLIEAESIAKSGGEGVTPTYRARDYLCKLDRFLAGSTVYPDAEPADVIRSLNRPTVELTQWFDQFSTNTLSNYSYNRGSWQISYGYLRGADNQAAKFCNLVTGSGSWTNHLARVTATPYARWDGTLADYTNSSVGIIARWQDASNYLIFYLGWLNNKKQAILSRVSGGSETVITSKEYPWEYGKTYLFRIRISGSNGWFHINEEPLFENQALGSIPSSGRIGVSTGATITYFDDLILGLAGYSATASVNSTDAWKVLDGDLDTKWSASSQAQGTYIQVDLGASQQICRVTLYQGDNYARNWKVETSTDGSTWTQRAAKTGDHRKTLDAIFSPVNARYVKVTITSTYSGAWDVKEFCIAKADGDQVLTIGQIDDYGSCMPFRFENETLMEAAYRVAEIIEWDLWAGTDGKLYFRAARGTDRSSTVKFEVGENIIELEEELDSGEWYTRIRVQGHGEWREKLMVVVQDQQQINQGIVREGIFAERDLIGLESLSARANALLAKHKNPRRTVKLAVIDEYGNWGLGDVVNVKDSSLGINDNLEVQAVDRVWSGEEGEDVEVELGNPKLGVLDVLRQLKDSTARLTFYSQVSSARYNADKLSGAYWLRFQPEKRRVS
ncbi:MAG: discoidin domain-containing protein [Candidatus Bathyarchaeia archaeon]